MDDFQECRTCLQQFNETALINVETKVLDHKDVLQSIREVASIEVVDNDLFPKYVCRLCFDLLVSALTFRKQIILTHIELKKRHECELRDPLFISCDDPSLEDKSQDQVVKLNDVKQEKTSLEGVQNVSDSDWAEPVQGNVADSSDDSFAEDVKPARKKVSVRRQLRHRRRLKVVETQGEDKKNMGNPNIEGPRLCPNCGKLFKNRQNFNSHMATVHNKTPEKPEKISCLCPDCGRVITGTRQNFVSHRRYHHSDKAQVKKRFTCDLCPKKFYREKNLVIHQRIHKGEKGYVCELCPDKSYTQIGGLILHKRKVHLKKPTCTCNYCGKQFYEKHYLETHIRQWHTGERPFSCEICGKAFSCNGTLLRHRKDSHGEKKSCPKCGKMYTEGELRKHLKRHKIREEGIKRKKYTCEYCGTEMNFTSRKRHLLKQHGVLLRGRGETAERVAVPTIGVL